MPAIILSGIALVASMLVLVGYGVSWAVETRFGVPHSTVFSSTTDLIDLSSVAVLVLIELAVETLGLFQQALSLNTAWRLRTHLLLTPIAVLLLMALLIMLNHYGPAFRQVVVRVQPVIGFFRRRRWHAWVAALVIGVPILDIGAVVVAGLGVVLTLVLATLIALPSWAGHELGVAYIDRWVVNADACTPLVPAASRLQAGKRSEPETASLEMPSRRRVNCVAVSKAGQRLIAGRVVAATSFAIVVYEPRSGAVLREPLTGLTVEAVDLADPLNPEPAIPQPNPPPAAPSAL